MKQDPKEVASAQKAEMQYIARVFFDDQGKRVTQSTLKEIMLKIGKDGKMNRSRAMIYAVLIDRGYVFVKPKRIRK